MIHQPDKRFRLWLVFCFILTIQLVVHCQYDEAFLPLNTDGIVPAESVSCPVSQQDSSTAVAFGMSKAFVTKAYTAWSLCSLARDGNLKDPIHQETYDRFVLYEDFNDKTIIVQTKGDPTCYATFQGTVSGNPWDQWQNVDPIPRQVPNSNCMVRGGFQKAYFSSYYDDFRQGLTECLESCDGGCPLILTGHSQGGGIAVVGSIDLRNLNPTTITFGGMRTLLRHQMKCTELDSNKHFRFQNTRGGFYDEASMTRQLTGAQQVGHSFFLSADNSPTTPLLYTGLDEDFMRLPMDIEVHRRDSYWESMVKLMNHECDPVPVGKWEESHWCGYDDECSNSMCTANKCTTQKQQSGEFCERDRDCLHGSCLEGLCTSSNGLLESGSTCTQHSSCGTGRCDSNGMCAQQLGPCDACQINEDCRSGNCALRGLQTICVPEDGLLEEGCSCIWNRDCDSAMCSGLLSRQCEARLETGGTCTTGSNCVSGVCSSATWLGAGTCE